MDMQEALQQVGYKPTGLRARLLNNARQKEARTPITLESFVDGVFAPLTKPINIVVTKAGTHRKAHYEGQTTFVFCCWDTTFEQIQRRLKFFVGEKKQGDV